MLLVAALWTQRVLFFCIFAVNRDSGTHPNLFLDIPWDYITVERMSVTQMVYTEDRASIVRGTTIIKGCGHFQGFRTR